MSRQTIVALVVATVFTAGIVAAAAWSRQEMPKKLGGTTKQLLYIPHAKEQEKNFPISPKPPARLVEEPLEPMPLCEPPVVEPPKYAVTPEQRREIVRFDRIQRAYADRSAAWEKNYQTLLDLKAQAERGEITWEEAKARAPAWYTDVDIQHMVEVRDKTRAIILRMNRGFISPLEAKMEVNELLKEFDPELLSGKP
ncbi:MAG TPA: hypothetical protein VFW87_26595 [Pirellulales bacterium]|nr:hypothetical protein [Pirellulales bacterium]